ncbi:unnamed protein product, partial [Amoebophrya sp. A25]
DVNKLREHIVVLYDQAHVIGSDVPFGKAVVEDAPRQSTSDVVKKTRIRKDAIYEKVHAADDNAEGQDQEHHGK